ncbi:MAG: hypothetical protein RL477_1241 [Pseudomonadota bacterium]
MPDSDRAPRFVEAEMSYIVEGDEKPESRSFGADNPEHTHTGAYERHRVRIENGRGMGGELSLDREGFRLARHETKVKDFYDEAEVRGVYYAELEGLVKRETGCARVHIFDHTRRAGDEETRNSRKVKGPVRHVHNDYTEWSGPQRVRDLLPAEADELLRHRFQVVQVWRAVRGPILSSPLGICDARSIAADDLIATARVYPNRRGEIYHVAFNPAHRWHYFPQMTRDEALVFKCYDSRTDVARFTVHCAFNDPTTPPGAPPRESMEARLLCFFDD